MTNIEIRCMELVPRELKRIADAIEAQNKMLEELIEQTQKKEEV